MQQNKSHVQVIFYLGIHLFAIVITDKKLINRIEAHNNMQNEIFGYVHRSEALGPKMLNLMLGCEMSGSRFFECNVSLALGEL